MYSTRRARTAPGPSRGLPPVRFTKGIWRVVRLAGDDDDEAGDDEAGDEASETGEEEAGCWCRTTRWWTRVVLKSVAPPPWS